MGIDPEDMKKQRQLREQQRREQAKRRKALFLRLFIAGAVLIASAILIFSLRKSPAETPDATQAASAAKPTGDTTVIHLAAAGDVNITDAVVASGGASFDYTETFLDVAPLLADADLTVLNFEGNLCGAPYGRDSAPQELAQALAKIGVDAVQLANSYSIHRGLSGLFETVNAARSAGLTPLGACASTQEAASGKGYTIFNVRGVRVALVAFTKGMDGMTLPADGAGCVNILYTDYDSAYQTVDTESIRAVLEAVQKEKPDITVAMLHWGSEFNDTVSKSQQNIVTLFQEMGVDAILGTHSHYVQKMDFDPDSGKFVAYSLGDFIGDAQRAGTEYGVVLDLEIEKNNRTGQTKIIGFDYTPTFTVAQKDQPLRTVRLAQAIGAYESGYVSRVSEETYSAMQYAAERVESRIHGE